MSLKLSPGCQCCLEDTCPYCSDLIPTEMDMTFAGFFNDEFGFGNCSDCETTLDGTYSLELQDTYLDCTWTYSADEPPTDAFATCDSGQYEWWICNLKLFLTNYECSLLSTNLNWKFYAQFNSKDTVTGEKGLCSPLDSHAPLYGYGTIAPTPHTFDCSAVSDFEIDNFCEDPPYWWTWCWWDDTLEVKISAG